MISNCATLVSRHLVVRLATVSSFFYLVFVFTHTHIDIQHIFEHTLSCIIPIYNFLTLERKPLSPLWSGMSGTNYAGFFGKDEMIPK
jgi:hypothetical protein